MKKKQTGIVRSDDVFSFLKVFHQSNNIDDIFTKESYWFSVILFRKFIRDGAEIVVDEDTGYFGTRIYGRVYDITGDITDNYRNWINKVTKVI